MRSVFRVLWLEFRFLKTSVILIGLILTIFCAAFLSVTSVFIDVPQGLYDYIGTESRQLAVALPGVSAKQARAYGGAWEYATKAGLTTDVILDTGDSRFAIASYEGKNDPFAYSRDNTVRAFALTPADFGQVGKHWEPILSEGRIPSAPDEFICTTTFARQRIGGARAGEVVLFGERPVTLVGIVDSAKVWDTDGAEGMPPLCSLYVCVSEDEAMDFCYLVYNNAGETHRGYLAMKSAGLPAQVAAENLFENVSNARFFFGAVALVLGLMVLFILYSLIAIFYRQRRVQICRMKLLGAKSGMTAGAYCLIACMLAVIAVAAGTFGSMLFNFYFMDLCTQLFEAPFASSFHIVVPAALLCGMLLFVLLLYAAFSVRIANTRIAQEIKHE